MKIVFLLALAGLSGLASCRSILPGGDQAKNVELEYTYIDEFGKPVKVKVQSDLINLSGIREVEKKEPETSFYRVDDESRKPRVEFKPLLKTIYITAPQAKPQVQYVVQPPVARTIEVEAPKPEVRYILQHGVPQAIKLDTRETEVQFVVQHPVPRAVEVKQPEVHTIYIQAPASSVPVSTVELKAPEPEFVYVTAPEPKTIKLDIDVKEHEDHHIFAAPSLMRTFQVKAPEQEVVYVTVPEHRAIKLDFDIKEPEDSHIFVTPSVRRTVEVKMPEPKIKHIVPAHFVVPTHTSKSLKTRTKKYDKKSNDGEDLGSAEK